MLGTAGAAPGTTVPGATVRGAGQWRPGRHGTSGGQGGAWDGGGQGGAWDGRGGAWGSGAWADEAGSGYRTAGNGYGGPATAYPAAGDRFSDGFDGAADGYGAASGYGAAGGYGAATDYDTSTDYNPTADYETGNGYRGRDGYRDWDGYGGRDGYRDWDGYAQAGQEFTGSAGYLGPDEHPGVGSGASSVLVAPDLRGEWWQQPDEGDKAGRDVGRDQVIIAAVTGFLSAAVAIGVATLAAGFVRPQASPASLIGGVLRRPAPGRAEGHGDGAPWRAWRDRAAARRDRRHRRHARLRGPA